MDKSFVENSNPEINVEDLLAQLGKEVEQVHSLPHQQLSDFSELDSLIDVPALDSAIASARAEGEVGVKVTPMHHFRWKLVQITARSVGGVILYLARFITAQQRRFNNFIVNTLSLLTSNLEQLDAGFSAWKQNENSLIEEIKKELENSLKNVKSECNHLKDMLSHADMTISDINKAVVHLKTALTIQESRLTMLLEEARKRLPQPFDEKQLKRFSDEKEHVMDSLYTSVSSLAQGTERDRQVNYPHYLSLVREVSNPDESLPVVDIGCGEGQWLEILIKQGIKCTGVESNSLLAEKCRNKGLDVTESDTLSYLTTLSDESVSAVTGFHVIEYLEYEEFIRVFDESFRVLKPGGIFIFETLNPRNISVSTYYFHADPRHKNLIPDVTLKLIAEARGLVRVKTTGLHPSSMALKNDDSELAQRFNDLFYSPHDYALTGYKA